MIEVKEGKMVVKKQREMKVSKVMKYQSKTRQDYEHNGLMAKRNKSGKQLTFFSTLQFSVK